MPRVPLVPARRDLPVFPARNRGLGTGGAPSAELKANQTDQDSLPPYPQLDAILQAYVENNESQSTITKSGYPAGVVKKVLRLVDQSEYKRRQAPIGIKITARALGKDRRMPITNRYLPKG